MGHLVNAMRLPLSAALLLLVLGSCATLERARVAFKPKGEGEITFLVRADTKGLPSERIPDSLIAEVSECGFNGKQMRRGGEVLADAYFKFTDAVAMARAIDCLPLDWTKRDIAMVEETGLLYKTYTATVWLEQPSVAISSVLTDHFNRARAASRGSKDEPEGDDVAEWGQSIQLLPLELSVVMPGGDLEVRQESKVIGATLHHTIQSNRAEIVMKLDGDKRNAVLDPVVDALNSGEKREIPNDVYKVTITSREARFELGTLGTLASVLGLLFGSGVLVQLFKWIGERRNRSRAEGADNAAN